MVCGEKYCHASSLVIFCALFFLAKLDHISGEFQAIVFKKWTHMHTLGRQENLHQFLIVSKSLDSTKINVFYKLSTRKNNITISNYRMLREDVAFHKHEPWNKFQIPPYLKTFSMGALTAGLENTCVPTWRGFDLAWTWFIGEEKKKVLISNFLV